MSRGFATALAAMGLLALGSVAVAQSQQTHELPPGSVIYPVHFPTGSYTLGSEDKDTIRAVASRLKNNQDLNATVIGKADSVGSADFNEHLAQKRAETVFDALVYTNQVPENRVSVQLPENTCRS